MPLITDFNQPPYYDDFDELKNFHRILFKPAVAVQARELTQLQTILQNQVERFGNNILRDGTIVAGGNFVEENPLPFVKVRDIAFDSNNQEVATDVNLYTGMKAVGKSTGVEGFVVATEFGLETQKPDLATLFVRYTKSEIDGSDNNVSVFSDTEEIELYAEDPITGEYSDLFHRVTVAGEVATGPVGNGYGVRCGDGIIFQKGQFIRFTDGLTIVSKYSRFPDEVVVGFVTDEVVVDSNEDSSLLDPASGFNNYNAPGADRIQLIPTLTVRTLSEAEEDEAFFAIQEYSDGNVVRRNISTQYNQILDLIEKRTSEESGDYVVTPFNMRTKGTSNNGVEIQVSPGLAYVNGKRVQTVGTIGVDIPQGNTYNTASDQDIIANYGNYYIVEPTSGTVGSFDFENVEEVEFKNVSDTTIGTAKIRAVTNDLEDGRYRLYVFNVSGDNLRKNAKRIVSTTDTGDATIVLSDGKAVPVDSNFGTGIFPIGRSAIRTVDQANTDYTFRRNITSTASSSTAEITVTVSGDETFPYTIGQNLNSDQIRDVLVIAAASSGSYSIGEVAEIDSVYVDNSQEMTITLSTAPGSTMAVNCYCNVKSNTVTINQKTLNTVYVKINCNSHPSSGDGKWSLGLPDVYRITNVYRNSNSSFTGIEDASNDVTNFFSLARGGNESLYQLSSLKKRQGINLGSTDRLLVKCEVFKKDSNPGVFFTVDSYPTDDVSANLPAGFIRTQDIPDYKGIRLRDAIDMRPIPANTAVYSTTSSGATVNPSSTNDYSTSNLEFPAPNATIETTYDYYLGRIDKLIVDEYGDFRVVQGTPDENPVSPRAPDRSMELARLVVPPFPSLPTPTANKAKKPEYGVTFSTDQYRRYTMKDIGDIDRRIENLEYYTAMSALETAASDMVITDGDGLNKFKNGIFVDNFTNLMLGDVKNDDFSASIDPARDVIQPRFRQYPIDLKYDDSSSNVIEGSDTAMFSSTNKTLINQPYATTTRSCTTDFYRYAGNMQINPEFDPGPDTQVAPDINIDIDLATPFIEYTDALAEIVPLQQTSSSAEVVGVETTTNTNGNQTDTTTTTTTALTDTLTQISVGAGQQITQDLGDFVTDVSFNPYMRSRRIQIYIAGLRPNTRHYFFFDETDVSASVARGNIVTEGQSSTIREIEKNGRYGRSVKTNADGELVAVFKIPKETFFVGDARLEVMDRPNYSEKADATSVAGKTYTAFNFSSTTASMAVTTRPPETTLAITSNTTINTSSTTTRTTTVTPTNPTNDPSWDMGDPIAQTFFIDPNLSNDNSIMVSELDLFFSGRSRNGNGVTVQIREVDNGYPAGKIVPFSNVHLKRNQVNVNTTDGTTATTIQFSNPIALRTGREYCFVIKPDGNDPDYRVWVSRIGQTDVAKGIAINQDTNSGTLFTSTNNRAWTPYQDENIKYKLKRHKFSTGTGNVKLKVENHEFFTVENVSGTFDSTEKVFREASAFSGTVSLVEESNTISGSGTSFNSDYQEGQWIVVEHAANEFEVLKIEQIVSDTSMTTRGVASVTATSSTHYSSPVGRVEWSNLNAPAQIVLIGSSASSTLKFVDGDVIRGADNSASADVVTVDDLPISYIEPKIARANFNRTATTLQASNLWNGASYDSINLSFNKSNFLYNKPYYIRSKSNVPTGNQLQLQVDMTADVDMTSPMVDHKASTMMAYRYIINNDATNEQNAAGGNAESKYISKEVILADGQASEDIRVFLDAFRPKGTTIHVYVRFHAEDDIRDFDDVEWTKLRLVSGATSSSANREDYRELEYDIPTAIPSPQAGGGAYYDNTAGNIIYQDGDGNEFTDFQSFAVKIVMLAEDHAEVPQIKNLRAIAVS